MLKIFIFIIFILFHITLFANTQKFDNKVQTLLKNENYKELAPILDKEINHLGNYKYIYQWAQMHEGGLGVKQNSKKAVELHKKAVAYNRNKDSAFRLGQYYYYGKIVDKTDKEKAVYWWRIGATLGSIKAMESYGLINIDNDFFHALVASKWMQYAEYKGSEKAKKFFQENPKLKDTKRYEKLRIYNIAQTPYEKKLSGIILGEKFNEELLISTSKIKPSISINIASYNQYEGVSKEYANKDDKYFKNLKQLDVRTTMQSNTVYRVEGYYFFKTEKECEKFEEDYFQKLSMLTSKIFSKVKNSRYIDIDVPNKESNIEFLYGMKPEKNQQGTRHILQHYLSQNKKGFYAQVIVIDFESLKLKVAEALKNDQFFEYVGKNYPKAHESRKHFGLTLLEKIPPNVRKKLISSSSSGKIYEIYPKYPHKFFQTYRVTTSVLTETIVKIEATGTFKNKMNLHNAYKGIMYNIYDKYKTSNAMDCYNSDEYMIDSKKGLLCYEKSGEKNQVTLSMKNEKSKMSFIIESDYAKKLLNKEYWLLNY